LSREYVQGRIGFLGGEGKDRRRIGLAERTVDGQGKALLLGVGWASISFICGCHPT